MNVTNHTIYFKDSRNLDFIPEDSIDLVLTSPPYPMIEMWDNYFCEQSSEIQEAFAKNCGRTLFKLMHNELDKVWNHTYRILKQGGIACINIGDATRTYGESFQLYSNHSRILSHCFDLGFEILPAILWRKTTNAPNKFMGSGMLPPGAYVTLEHEYILILRKGYKRKFQSSIEKQDRQQSAYFWEERNIWFSDVWELKGIRQELSKDNIRKRSGAFPFELAYRLINMFSTKYDVVLDPFLGTGTTTSAAICSERNSVGVEIDQDFRRYFAEEGFRNKLEMNEYIAKRIQHHIYFIKDYVQKNGSPKYVNEYYGFPVITSQETQLNLRFIENIEIIQSSNLDLHVTYTDKELIGELQIPMNRDDTAENHIKLAL